MILRAVWRCAGTWLSVRRSNQGSRSGHWLVGSVSLATATIASAADRLQPKKCQYDANVLLSEEHRSVEDQQLQTRLIAQPNAGMAGLHAHPGGLR